MFRILHVGLGPLGQMIVADLHERRLGEIVGAVDTSSDVAGRKLSDVVPSIKSKVVVQKSIEDVKSLDSIHCAIVTTSSELEKCAPTFRDLLGRGMSVVSTCEELCYPHLRHKKLAQELDVLARDGRGRLLGTGVNPGFLMDAFPVLATAISPFAIGPSPLWTSRSARIGSISSSQRSMSMPRLAAMKCSDSARPT